MVLAYLGCSGKWPLDECQCRVMQNEVLGFRFVVFGTSAVRSVMLNLANKFSQCSFSVTEHYDLFSGLIILRQV